MNEEFYKNRLELLTKEYSTLNAKYKSLVEEANQLKMDASMMLGHLNETKYHYQEWLKLNGPVSGVEPESLEKEHKDASKEKLD